MSGRVSMRIEPDLNPEAAAHLSSEAFDGPLGLLLTLIEQRQLDILEVPLADLAGAYLEALSALTEDQMSHLSAFVTLASHLILIKSRALLPRPPDPAVPAKDDGPDPEEALRQRLIVYRRYRDSGAILGDRLATGLASFHREPAAALAAAQAGARPAPGPVLDPAVLVSALVGAFQVVPPPPPPPQVMKRTVTLEERSRVIRAALRSAPTIVLQELLSGVRDRVVIAVTFLAMLELVKGREVTIEQAEPWGPIECRSRAPLVHPAAL